MIVSITLFNLTKLTYPDFRM